MTAEFTREEHKCDECDEVRQCTYVKHAHVPLYSWACEDCYDSVVSE